MVLDHLGDQFRLGLGDGAQRVQALPSGIMKQICPAHVERLRPKPQPVAPTPGGKITYDPENLEDMRRTFPEAEAACGIPITPNLDTRRLDRALDKIKAEHEDGDTREEDVPWHHG